MSKLAIIVDGGYIRARIQGSKGALPEANDIYQEITKIAGKHFPDDDLFRIFYYDSIAREKYNKEYKNPVDGEKVRLYDNINRKHHDKLYTNLKSRDDVAFRYGELGYMGWRLKSPNSFIKKMQNGGTMQPKDFCINVRQKGVDLKMGIDIAWISMKSIVDKLLIISADSDLIPALKFARKEGLKVYIAAIGHGVKPELKEHSDKVFKV